jgi:hypothetical protein
MEHIAELDALCQAVRERHPEWFAFMEAVEADLRWLAEQNRAKVKRQLDNLGFW